jgi:hypothetical protein
MLEKEMWCLRLTAGRFASGRGIWQVWVSGLMVWDEEEENDGRMRGSDQECMGFG